jgi:hypothetical protein
MAVMESGCGESDPSSQAPCGDVSRRKAVFDRAIEAWKNALAGDRPERNPHALSSSVRYDEKSLGGERAGYKTVKPGITFPDLGRL